ncbi:hypothetical protein KIN20_009195 [Parelaphostrongylus tenuis]|uniref:Uncharacterized protein n=1 Tax=Parelaphostrongylus tenuis TaxID=148309 RepID=A0AAD5M5Z0_PARTN|nr:hypothetical protein KIN20_009195 [Parelaphostrongylus tenuis]
MAKEITKEQKAFKKEEEKEEYKQAWRKMKPKLDELRSKLINVINATKDARKEVSCQEDIIKSV